MASIKAGTPFRAAMLMSMQIAAVQSLFARDMASQQQALSALGPYEGRGKGKTRPSFSFNDGSRRTNRAATKRRNVLRHRKAGRG